MEERASYLRSTPRPGRTFVGGYISTQAAERLRKAAELNDMNMTELLEWLAGQLRAEMVTDCECRHE